MMRILHFSLPIIMIWRVSENLKDGKGVFGGRGSAWLAIKTKAEKQKGETTTEAQSVEPLQKDVDNLLVTVCFSL